jgi:hypothetical protein
MSILPKSQTCDRYARASLTIGIVGAILTGGIHYEIVASSHFDFLVRDGEFYLVLGMVLIVAALSLVDLRAGLFAIRHLNQPHGKFTRSLAVTGITLGIADILPAAIILAIMFETFLLKFIQIKSFFAY